MPGVNRCLSSTASNDLRQALYIVAIVDVALLLVPLALLTAASPSEEGCGWTPQALDVHCAVALALLWLSLVITASQLVAISAAGPLRRALFVHRLWWHLPASLTGTAFGGAVGLYALSGYLALVRGECGNGSKGILWTSVIIGSLVMVVYIYISRVEAKAVEGLVFQDDGQSLLLGHSEHPKGDSPKEVHEAHQPGAFVSVVTTAERKPVEDTDVGSSRTRNIQTCSRSRDNGEASTSGSTQGSNERVRACALGVEKAGDVSSIDSTAPDSNERDRYTGNTSTPSSGNSASLAVANVIEVQGNRNTAAADAAAGGSASDEDRVYPVVHDAGAAADANAADRVALDAGAAPDANVATGAGAAADAGAGRNGRQSGKGKAHLIHDLPIIPTERPPPGAPPHMVVAPESKFAFATDLSSHQPIVSSFGSIRRAHEGQEKRRRSAEGHHRRRKSDEHRKQEKRRWSALPPDSNRNSIVATLAIPLTCPGNSESLTPNNEESEEKKPNIAGLMEKSFRERRMSLRDMEEQENPSPKRGNRMSTVAFQEPEITVFPVDNDMRRCSRRPASPTFDAVVFNFNQNPINFDNLMDRSDSDMEEDSDISENSDDSDPSRKESNKSEVWKNKSQPKVEVPIWLMERTQQARARECEDDGDEDGTDSPTADGAPRKIAKTRPGTPDETSNSERIICEDVEIQEEDKDTSRKSRSSTQSQKKQSDQSKLNPNAVIVPSNTFWKIPMPTRKNTMMIQVPQGAKGHKKLLEAAGKEGKKQSIEEEDEEEDSDEEGDEEAEGSEGGDKSPKSPKMASKGWDTGLSLQDVDDERDSAERPSLANPEGGESGRRVSFCDQKAGMALPKYSEDKKPKLGKITEDDEPEDVAVRQMPMKPPTKRGRGPGGSRRPSVLGVFSDVGAKQEGLYMLPKHQDNSSEVVEVRRSSLVMSTSMLNDILKQKVQKFRKEDGTQINEIHSVKEEDEDVEEEQVVLPFFSPVQKASRSDCQCKTDPVTGYVIHTCMTPSATQSTNTEAMASYLCSEWGSRRHSYSASRSSKSRRNSGDFDGGEEDDHPTSLVPPPPKPVGPNRKRIRNASMLAVVGGQGPTAAKKTEVEEEPIQDNELAISFKNIQAAGLESIPDGEVNGITSPDGKDIDELANREQRVEADLGHRFELVEPYILAGMLKDPEVREQLLTVDVRGRDWVGGHIPSSINLRTSEVVENPFQLLVQCRRNRVHHIIFTCMYSVLRARKCAVAVEKAQEQEKQAGNEPYRLRISLLAGGMHAWINHFMKSQHDTVPKCYIDGFEPDMWSDGGPSQGGLVHVMDALWSSGGQKALSDALSQELEQLLTRRRGSSQLSSRRESSEVAVHPVGSGEIGADTPVTPEMVASELMQARPRRGSGQDGQPVHSAPPLPPGLINLTPKAKEKDDSDSNADSDMT